MAETIADRVRAASWPALAALALVETCLWLNNIRPEYLVGCALATVGAGGALRVIPPPRRRWAIIATVGLVALAATAAATQWRVHRIDADWPDVQSALVTDGLATLDQEVAHAIQDLRAVAARALDAPSDTTGAFAAIEPMGDGFRDGGLILYERDSAFAWGGRIRVPTDSLRDSVGVTRTSFYLSLYAVAARGQRRVVAVRLLDAESPADRLTQPLAGEVAKRIGIGGFTFTTAAESAERGDAQPLRAGSRVLAYARLVPMVQGRVRQQVLERMRLVIALVVAFVLVCYIVATWRMGRQFRWRLTGVGVAMLCTALAPLHAFSNYSRMFDPALYTTSIGRDLTTNAGALAITGALIMLALLAAVRRLGRGSPRIAWIAVVAPIAVLGPFLLRDLSRGIHYPANGVNAWLWMIWEVPIFLTASSVLLAAAAAGSAALGSRRGIPPWVGPLIACAAALLAPITWQATEHWPVWYPLPWIGAAVAVALSRRSRRMVVSAATVAALGATTLVWGATTRGRIALADHDVHSLSETDTFTLALIGRFAGTVDAADRPVASRAWLLRVYAASEIASGGYPAWLAMWQNDSLPAVTFQTTEFDVPQSQVRAIVRVARRTQQVGPVIPLLAEPADELALAVPTDSGVVVAVAAPRTRLIAGDPYARLFGIEQLPEAEPPYAMRLAGPVYPAPPRTPRVNWRRIGDTLDGDWIARTGVGASRLHVEIELRSVTALVERGVLIVLADLVIVGLLWLGSVLADGAMTRWLRERQRRWRRSYRTQLTLALFAFFMIPAAVFAIWSYRELASDAAQSRELLVRETLRAVAPLPGNDDWLASESRRLGTPLFFYRGGELVSASDPLLAALATTGRFLPPSVYKSFMLHDENAASRQERIGQTSALFGFRAVEGTTADVVAAPARADDLVPFRRRRDLGVLVLFATAIGALAAFWLSGIAARQLARPIQSLRQAALRLAAGGHPRALENPTVEFRPVFAAFRRMANDLDASRAATAHAQRVLAWGEMARQIAHEIKNPLTPIRLGVQHLQRARADKRVDFDRVLDENVKRILAEIDHLDEIARAFSRYGSAPGDRAPAEPTDVSEVVRDLIGLERMGEGRISWVLAGADARAGAIAQRDELREVLLNVYENARLAGAAVVTTTITRGAQVTVEVRDDGHGIPADVLPRIFEPHFSTRTSGSGLGLAISRRLIEGWGGKVVVESGQGTGTTVRIVLVVAGP